jgi:hypothetical protein
MLGSMFVLAMLMGPGPGMAVANYPVSWGGLPALYVWGLLWYVVLVTVVTLCYVLLWRMDDAPHGSERTDEDGRP